MKNHLQGHFRTSVLHHLLLWSYLYLLVINDSYVADPQTCILQPKPFSEEVGDIQLSKISTWHRQRIYPKQAFYSSPFHPTNMPPTPSSASLPILIWIVSSDSILNPYSLSSAAFSGSQSAIDSHCEKSFTSHRLHLILLSWRTSWRTSSFAWNPLLLNYFSDSIPALHPDISDRLRDSKGNWWETK